MLDFVSGLGPNPLVSEVSVLDGTMGSLGQTMTGLHNVLDCKDSVSTGWHNGLDDTGDVHIIRTFVSHCADEGMGETHGTNTNALYTDWASRSYDESYGTRVSDESYGI